MRALVRAALMAAIVVGGASPGRAAVYDVDTTTDLPDVLPGDGLCATGSGDCSLRAAVMTANANPGPDTINVPASVTAYKLTYHGAEEDAGLTGDLDVLESVDIVGAGTKDVVVDGDDADRVFHVFNGAIVSISGLTIQNGRVATTTVGGGVLVAGAALTLTGVRVTSNLLTNPGATNLLGGGIFAQIGSLTVSDSTIDANAVTTGGTASGGGLAVFSATVSITNTTISGNSVTGAAMDGAAIACGNAGPSFNNVTISANAGAAAVSRTIAGGPPTFRNSIVAGNSPSDCTTFSPSFPMASLGYTLFGTLGAGCTVVPGPGDIVNPAPGLVALADNGGSTPTHALLAASPAIAAGSPDIPGSMTATACDALDQRGGPRGVPTGTRCDMGAYETGCGNLFPDQAEICDGGDCCTVACGFAANLTPCPDEGNECTNDRCNGASALCQHPAKLDGTACTDDGEFCTNDHCAAGACSHPAKTNGTPCTDEPNACTTDTCQLGICYHDPVSTGTPCDDANACTAGDSCSSGGICMPGPGCAPCTTCTGPLTGCVVGATPTCTTPPEKKSAFSVKLGVTPADAKFKWKWTKGPNVSAADLGDPATGGSGYTLCVFDQDGAALSFQAEVAPGGSCGTTSCWRPAKTGFKFFDRTAAQDGVRGIQAFAGDFGKAKFVVSGKGAAIPTTNLPYTPKVVVELHRTDAPVCWSGRFESHVLATTNVFFKAVSDP